MTFREAQAAARRGARLLDEHFGGRGWRRGIKLRKLDMKRANMREGCGCILAQLGEPDGLDYYSLIEELNVAAETYGFSGETNGDFERLDRAWKALLRR